MQNNTTVQLALVGRSGRRLTVGAARSGVKEKPMPDVMNWATRAIYVTLFGSQGNKQASGSPSTTSGPGCENTTAAT